MCTINTNVYANSYMHPTYVILGSGGHTAEMCQIITALLQTKDGANGNYSPIRYIVAQSDAQSEQQLLAALPQTKHTDFLRVPRSREVGQSWLSSLFTTLWALLWSCWLIWRERPQLVMCNGPGTCVPYCYAFYFWRLLRRLPPHSKIVFVESFCRVQTLSLSGRLLLPLADMFVVQWPALSLRYGHYSSLRYFGRIL